MEETSIHLAPSCVKHSQPTPFFKIGFRSVRWTTQSARNTFFFFFWFNLVFHVLYLRAEINIPSKKECFYDPIRQFSVSQVMWEFLIGWSLNRCVRVFVSTCFFRQVNEDRVQQMERENSFITRWNEKKDATVSRPSRTEMESTDGCSVCLCVYWFARVRQGPLKSGFHLSEFPVFLGKNEADGGVGRRWSEGKAEEAGAGGWGKKGLCSC